MSYLLNNPNYNVQFGQIECSDIESSGIVVSGDLECEKLTATTNGVEIALGGLTVQSGDVDVVLGDVNITDGNLSVVGANKKIISPLNKGNGALDGTNAVEVLNAGLDINSVIMIRYITQPTGTITITKAAGKFDIVSTQAGDNNNFEYIYL